MASDELPTIGDTAMLTQHRRRSGATLLRAKVAEGLRKLAGYIAKNQLQAGSPHAAFVVLLTDDEPVLTWYGDVDWDDLRTASCVMHDASMARYRSQWGKDRTIADRVSDGWRQRQKHEARRVQKQAAEADEKPWMCEHCDRRFKTERGANQHERGCWKNPQARQYQPGGGYRMHTTDDGQFGGFYRIDMSEQPGDDRLPEDP